MKASEVSSSFPEILQQCVECSERGQQLECTQAMPHFAAWMHRNPFGGTGWWLVTGSGAFLSAHHLQPSLKRMV